MYEKSYELKQNLVESIPTYIEPSVVFYKPSPLVAEEKSMAAVALAGLAVAAKAVACACACTSIRGYEKADRE